MLPSLKILIMVDGCKKSSVLNKLKKKFILYIITETWFK